MGFATVRCRYLIVKQRPTLFWKESMISGGHISGCISRQHTLSVGLSFSFRAIADLVFTPLVKLCLCWALASIFCFFFLCLSYLIVLLTLLMIFALLACSPAGQLKLCKQDLLSTSVSSWCRYASSQRGA